MSGGQYRLRMLMVELSTVILTPWISACSLVSTLKLEAAMVVQTSISTPPFPVQPEGLVASDGKSVVGVRICL